jgi:hypothetical protein
MLTITTPYGNRYRIHDNGDIETLVSLRGTGPVNNPPSGKWKMLGIKPCNGGGFIPLERITKAWLAKNPLLYKNGNPRYTVVDLDHGTRREWGNTKHHGIKSITIDTPKHVGTWVLVVDGGEIMKYGKDSDTIYPYPPDDKEALEEAAHQARNEKSFNSTVYILHVFDNGQLKQFEFDLAEYEEAQEEAAV